MTEFSAINCQIYYLRFAIQLNSALNSTDNAVHVRHICMFFIIMILTLNFLFVYSLFSHVVTFTKQ